MSDTPRAPAPSEATLPVGRIEAIVADKPPTFISRLAADNTARAIGIAAAVLILVLCLAFYDVIFGGKTLISANAAGVMGGVPPYGTHSEPWGYHGEHVVDAYRLDRGASAWAIEPIIQKVHQLLFDFRVPLWNANAGTGRPLLANMLSSPFNPLIAPILLHPSPYVWDFYLVGRFFFGGLAAFLFARALGLSIPGGLTTSVGYILSGFLIFFSNNNYLDVYFTLPLVLFTVELCVLRMRPRYSLFVALAVAFNLVAGLPEASFVTLLLAGGYALYRLFSSWFEDRDLKLTRLRFVYLVIGFGAGAAFAMPQLMPFGEYLRQTFTTHTGGGVGLGFDPPKYAANLLIPYIDGQPGLSESAMAWSGTRNYVGMILPLLGLIGLFYKPLGLRAGWYFAAALLLGVLKTYGAQPINHLGSLPLAQLTIFQQWLAPVNAFCVAICAGIGVERIYRGEKLRWTLPAATSLLFLILLFLLQKNWAHVDHLGREGRMWLEFGVGMALLASFLIWAGERSPKRQGWVCLVLVSAEMLLFVPHGIYRDRFDTFAKPPFINYLEARVNPDRGRIYGSNGILYPNDSSAYNIDDIRSLDATYPDRYFEYVQQFLSPVVDRFVGDVPPVSYSSNPFFDLLGVKYVLTPKDGLPPSEQHSLIDETVTKLGKTPQHDATDYTIDGVKRHVLFAHAPSDLPLDLTISPSERVLRFSPALDPGMWDKTGNTGVEFEILAGPKGSTPQSVWKQVVDPVENPADRHWVDAQVDLAQFGPQATVILRTSLTNPSNAYDWSAWGGLQLGGLKSPQEQFNLVYDDELRIYENPEAYSRAFVVQQVNEVKDGPAALATMKKLDFNPAVQAVVEGALSSKDRDLLANSSQSTGSKVTVSDYRDAQVRLSASMSGPGLVVLSDTYFPGWKAYVDGKQVDIHRTDYAFRGVVVSQGTHEIVFKYAPASFRGGVLIAFVTGLGFVAWWAFLLYRRRKASRGDSNLG